MGNLIVLDLDLWLANFKFCLKIWSGWSRFVWSHCNYEIEYWQVKIESNTFRKRKKKEKNEQTNLILFPWAGHELTSLSAQLAGQVCLLLNTLVTPQRKTYQWLQSNDTETSLRKLILITFIQGIPAVIVGITAAIKPSTYDMEVPLKDVICGPFKFTGRPERER